MQVMSHPTNTAVRTSQLAILFGHPEHLGHIKRQIEDAVTTTSMKQKISFIEDNCLDVLSHLATENFKEGFEIVFCLGFPPDTKTVEHVFELFERVIVFSVETDPEAYGRQLGLSSHDRKHLKEALAAREMQMSGLLEYVARKHRHRFDVVHHKRSIKVQAVHIVNKVFGKMGQKLIPSS